MRDNLDENDQHKGSRSRFYAEVFHGTPAQVGQETVAPGQPSSAESGIESEEPAAGATLHCPGIHKATGETTGDSVLWSQPFLCPVLFLVHSGAQGSLHPPFIPQSAWAPCTGQERGDTWPQPLRLLLAPRELAMLTYLRIQNFI